MNWNPEKYLKFQKERTQPSADLVNAIELAEPRRIIDIGCGPGNSSERLKLRFPDAGITGVDSSEDMINAARKNYPDISFSLCDASKELGSLSQGEYDIVFSNACIQWIPRHEELLPQMFSLLRKGGVMAVQIPLQRKAAVHSMIGEIAERDKWREKFSRKRIFTILEPSEYYDILSQLSGSFRIWETTYYHELSSAEDILDWYRGTGLRPYLEQLDESDIPGFEADILSEIKRVFPLQKNGRVILPFPRLFFIAER